MCVYVCERERARAQREESRSGENDVIPDYVVVSTGLSSIAVSAGLLYTHTYSLTHILYTHTYSLTHILSRSSPVLTTTINGTF